MVAPTPVTDPANLAEAQARVKAARLRQMERAQVLEASMAARRAAAQAAEAERERRALEAEAARLEAIEEATRATLAAFPASAMTPTPRRVIAKVCAAFGLSIGEIVGPSREVPTVRARFAAIYAVKRVHPRLSLSQMGRLFGGRHHTSILSALQKMERCGVPQPDGSNLKADGASA